MGQTLIIDNNTVNSLLLNNKLTSTFAFLKAAADKKGFVVKSGGCCGQTQSLDYNAIKAAIAALQPADRTTFKTLVNADTVKVQYVVSNRVVETSF